MASTDVDVVIVGAGFAGMYELVRMRRAGFSAVVLETADDGAPPPAIPVTPVEAAPAEPAAAEPPAEVDLNVVHSEDYDGELDDPHTREEEFVRNLVETLDASEEEIG